MKNLKLKKYGYIGVILGFMVICILIGFTTRLSFTNVANDPAVPNSPYWYSQVTTSSLTDNIQDIINEADLIAKVKFHGNREYKNKSYITEVEVLSIYKGDIPDNTENIIQLYEPINISYFSVNTWLNDPESVDFIHSLYPGIKTNDSIISISPITESMFHHAPMKEDREYLVFLNPKKYSKNTKNYYQKTEYNYVDSIYSIIDLSIPTDKVELSPRFLTLEEAMEYPILINNDSDLELYIKNVKKVKDYFSID